LFFAGLLRPDMSALRHLDRVVAIVAGTVIGVLVGAFIAGNLFSAFTTRVLIALLCGGLGALFGVAYQPGQRSEGWTDSVVASLFPGLADWFTAKGNELARKRPDGQPLAEHELPPRGYLLHITLDIILPVFVGILAFVLVVGGNSQAWGWTNFDGTAAQVQRNNGLFWFGREILGLEVQTAAAFARGAFLVIVYGIPLCMCFMFFARPLRFGLALGAVLLANGLYQQSKESLDWDRYDWGWVRRSVLHQDRSYFGILRVHEDARLDPEKETVFQSNTYLMHGTTHHGLNYQIPQDQRRLATTYYHRYGPVGVVMRRIDWFPAPRPTEVPPEQKAAANKNWNTYWADARLPVSVLGSLANPMPGLLNSPAVQLPALVGANSEPPYACVGLGTGTMASYCRPFQHLTFYEIDNKIRSFSEHDFTWPDGKQAPYFNYVHDARQRGARIEIYMGDARYSMAKERPQEGIVTPQRKHYYRVIELDAFSSDAIPVHLITREAIEMYFDKLMLPQDVEVTDAKGKKTTEHFSGGVLMVHTSNRHVDLVRPVVDVANSLGLKWRVGKDGFDRREGSGDPSDKGRFSSEYVMLAKDERDLPPESTEDEIRNYRETGSGFIWTTPPPTDARVWTDDFSNLLGAFRWR
jgi:hypothetical protein